MEKIISWQDTIKIRNFDLQFNSQGHKYHYKEKELESVTTRINRFTSFNEDKILSKPKYKDCKEKTKEEWKRKREERQHIGSLTHSQIELFLQFNIHPKDPTPEFYSFLKFYTETDFKHVKNILIEKSIHAQELGMAGTCDIIAEDFIIDWKTQLNLEDYKKDYNTTFLAPIDSLPETRKNKWALQLSFYKYFLRKYYNKDIPKIYAIILDSQGYRIEELPYLENEIHRIL